MRRERERTRTLYFTRTIVQVERKGERERGREGGRKREREGRERRRDGERGRERDGRGRDVKFHERAWNLTSRQPHKITSGR